MSRLLYVLRKSITNILERPLSAVTSLLSLSLLFLMFDIVWISSLSANKYYEGLVSNVCMEIFLEDSLPDSTVSVIRETIGGLDGVENIKYISKEDARGELHSLMGTDLLEGLDDNPLPRSIVMEFNEEYLNSDFLNSFEKNLHRIQGISEIYYPKHWLEKTEYTISLILKLVIFLGVVISLAVILNLLHSVRLSVRTRAEELTQVRLLGGGKTFLSVPYIFEGAFYALVASIAGWLAISYSAGRLTFRTFEVLFPAQTEVIYFCLIASLVGMLGGYIGIRRSL